IGLLATGVGLVLILLLALSIRKGKRESDKLLHNILPMEVAAELKSKGKAVSKKFDNITVLFTDFKGFTAIAEKLEPQELVDDLNIYFSAFDAIMEKYGVEKIKTIGDAYMAVSGLPKSDPKHAENVLKASLEMVQFMKERKERVGEDTFEIRIGIHSGNVIAGIVGTHKYAYDIWGDTVNTAARMEQNSLPGRINVSNVSYEHLKHTVEFTYRGELPAKNKGAL
ncbi:MAG: adenylate/guanylate cyclase domain-containing protein, partial [Saprospiraceae bacterium]|nr:adenylate/guanylate cyclase domain-containing protein [Saprospiraceae bacterium]